MGVIYLIVTPSFSLSGQLGNWSIINNLNVPRSDHSVVSNGQYLYVLGGYAYTSTPYPVERAEILSSGYLGPWTIESTSMIQPRADLVSAYVHGYLYAFGGVGDVSYSTTVERAKVNLDGTLSEWSTIGYMPKELSRMSSILYGDYFYLIGGFMASPDIYRTTLNPDGTIGTWTLLSSKLNIGRHGHMSILIDTTVYVVSGVFSSGLTQSIEKATVFPDGTLSAFTVISYTGGGVVHIQGALFYDRQYLNIVGGYNSGNYNYRSECATVNLDGSLGTWSPGPGLQVERGYLGYAQSTIAAYVIGGWNGSDVPTVEYAPMLGATGIEKKDWEIFE